MTQDLFAPFIDVINNNTLLILLNVFFIIATITDIKFMKIFDVFNLIMLVTRIVTFFIFGFNFSYLLGGALIFVTFLGGALVTKAQIGGDIKFGGNIGLWIGFIPSAIVILLSIVINFIYRKITKNTKAIALAPFLYAGFLILLVLFKFVIK